MKPPFATICFVFPLVCFIVRSSESQDLPLADSIKAVKLFEVDSYCEGVVFDYQGRGYISWKETVTRFELDGSNQEFAKTGAPNGHKILADGTHLICDASQHAVVRLTADGKPLEPASKECEGKPLRGPNDLTLGPTGGFYFTDPGESSIEKPIGTVHYVDIADPQGKLVRQYPGGNRQTSNVAFGGPKREQLFVTGSINADGKPGAVFRLDLGILGRVVLPPIK